MLEMTTYSNYILTSVVVSNMDHARAKKEIPVPQVYDYSYLGNCTYILMQRFRHVLTAEEYIHMQECKVPKRLGLQVRTIVAALATVGLSHNDLYPRNLSVHRLGNRCGDRLG